MCENIMSLYQSRERLKRRSLVARLEIITAALREMKHHYINKY